MDKFDESIKQGSVAYQPSQNFTDQVMNKLHADSVKRDRSFGWRNFTLVLGGMAAVVALVFVGNTTVFHATHNSLGSSQTASEEFSTELNAITKEFAIDNTANAISSSDLNDLSP
jgi:hypothetical protein